MAFLVRSINRAKWNKNNKPTLNEVAADAITNCMETRLNTLSVWEINDMDELEDAVVAIASNSDSAEKMHFIWIEEKTLHDNGILLEQKDGITGLANFSQRHFDMEKLDYGKLGILATHTINAIFGNGEYYKFFLRSEITRLFAKYYDDGKLNVEQCNNSAIKKIIAKRQN